MLTQLALDRMTEKEIFGLLEKVAKEIDIIEVGTGVIKQYGMRVIEKVNHQYPNILLLADMKTCDVGESESVQAFEAGADITTCMAFAPLPTIDAVVQTAKKYNKEVMIDLLGMQDKQTIKELYHVGCHYFGLHIGKDEQISGLKNYDYLYESISDVKSIKIAIAGGIDDAVVSSLDKSIIDITIIGSAITKSEDPLRVIRQIKQDLNN